MSLDEITTSNLVVALQKLAKNGSYYPPAHRARLLRLAAERLTEYRQRERADESEARFQRARFIHTGEVHKDAP